MEGKEGNGSGTSVKKEEAPVSHQLPPPPVSYQPPPPPPVSYQLPPPPASAATTPDPVLALAVFAGADPGAGSSSSGMKKKRGRPRKFGPDGVALSPMPISASIPLAGEIPAWQPQRGKVTPVEIIKNKQNFAYENPAEKMACLVSPDFRPHVIIVNPGEDVIMKIMAISKQGGRAVCVLSANGTIANVSLCQSTSSGGTVTYEGRFELISLTGSYMPVATGGTTSTTGRMSVSLASPDGRVFGGGLAGLLVAASPVQVVVGSFIPPGQQQHQQQIPRSQRPESVSDPSTMFRQETTNVAFAVNAKPIATEEDNIVPVQSIANSLGGNKISFSANGLSSS